MDNRLLQNWFSPRRPMPEVLSLMNDIHQAARDLAHTLNQALPECADKTATFRQLRQVVLMANDTLLRNRRDNDASEERRPAVYVKPTF